jgi:hypothetical protein
VNKYLLRLAEREPVEIPTAELEMEFLDSSANGWIVISPVKPQSCSFHGLYAAKETAETVAAATGMSVVQVTSGILSTVCPKLPGSFVIQRQELEANMQPHWPTQITYKFASAAAELFGDRSCNRAIPDGSPTSKNCIIEIQRSDFPLRCHKIESLLRDFTEARYKAQVQYDARQKVAAREAGIKVKPGQKAVVAPATDAVIRIEKQYGATLIIGSPVVFSIKKTKELVAGTIVSVTKTGAIIKPVMGEKRVTVNFSDVQTAMHFAVCNSLVGGAK